jgi:hypothetical protein
LPKASKPSPNENDKLIPNSTTVSDFMKTKDGKSIKESGSSQ